MYLNLFSGIFFAIPESYNRKKLEPGPNLQLLMAKTVLLTGANGFLGAHILSQLLSSNFTVCAIVRSQTKADQVRSDNPTAGPHLLFGIVPDITTPGAFNEVFKSGPPIDIVMHTASPFNYKAVTNNLKDVMIPAKQGTEEILRAIKANAPSVKRVVLTSSIAAVLDFDAGNNGRRYTADDWNPATWEQGVEGNTGVGYRASKKYAEKAGMCFEIAASDLARLLGTNRTVFKRGNSYNERNPRSIWSLCARQ